MLEQNLGTALLGQMVLTLNHANFYRNSAGTTQTSGLIWGGYEPPSPAGTANTESWNGTAFTEQADLAVKRYGNTDIGTGATSAALCRRS